jgi:hypothetical protein
MDLNMNPALRKLILICVVLTGIPGQAGAAAADREAAIEVCWLDGDQGGWWVAETANFRIFHRQDADAARAAARIAEQTRGKMYHKWFRAAGQGWEPRCHVFLHSRSSGYFREAGFPSALPGISSIQTDSGRIISRRIDLDCDNPDLLPAVLPHEVTHIVLWSWFGQKGLPQWVNEGIAVLTEPRDRIERHLRNLPRHRNQGELFALEKLMNSREYPDRHFLGAFYAQSVSLVDFLARTKGPETFARFVREGTRWGFDSASKRYYGWSLDELEREWQHHAFRRLEHSVSVSH